MSDVDFCRISVDSLDAFEKEVREILDMGYIVQNSGLAMTGEPYECCFHWADCFRYNTVKVEGDHDE